MPGTSPSGQNQLRVTWQHIFQQQHQSAASFVLPVWKRSPAWTDAAPGHTSLHLSGSVKGRVSRHSAFRGRRWCWDCAATAYKGNPSLLGMLLHWTYEPSLWGIRNLWRWDGGDDHLQATRCKEKWKSLQGVENQRVARSHCPAGKGQGQPELFEKQTSLADGGIIAVVQSGGRKRQNQPQWSKCCASLGKLPSHSSWCRRHLGADGSQIDSVLQHVQDHLNSSTLSPKWIINHPQLTLAWYRETADTERWRLWPLNYRCWQIGWPTEVTRKPRAFQCIDCSCPGNMFSPRLSDHSSWDVCFTAEGSSPAQK